MAGMALPSSDLSKRITQLINLPKMKSPRFKLIKVSMPAAFILLFSLLVLPGFTFISSPLKADSPAAEPEPEILDAPVSNTALFVSEEASDELKPSMKEEVATENPPAFKSAIEPVNETIAYDCKDLLAATKANNVDKVREILKSVDPDCAYRDGGEPRSPLVAAARKGYLEIGQLLIASGADADYHDRGDESPLMAAAANGNLDFVQLLTGKGADVNKMVKGDGTALLVASREGHLDIVEYLIGLKADVNAVVGGDGTPSDQCCSGGALRSIKNVTGKWR